jgi:hypothetical protein
MRRRARYPIKESLAVIEVTPDSLVKWIEIEWATLQGNAECGASDKLPHNPQNRCNRRAKTTWDSLAATQHRNDVIWGDPEKRAFHPRSRLLDRLRHGCIAAGVADVRGAAGDHGRHCGEEDLLGFRPLELL